VLIAAPQSDCLKAMSSTGCPYPFPVPLSWTGIDWAARVQNRVVAGRRVHVVDEGSGPAVMLLHGMASSWQWWLENIPPWVNAVESSGSTCPAAPV